MTLQRLDDVSQAEAVEGEQDAQSASCTESNDSNNLVQFVRVRYRDLQIWLSLKSIRGTKNLSPKLLQTSRSQINTVEHTCLITLHAAQQLFALSLQAKNAEIDGKMKEIAACHVLMQLYTRKGTSDFSSFL